MTAYAWKGLQANQLTEGTIDAISFDDAKQKLRENKIVITQLESQEEEVEDAPKERTTYSARKIKNKQLMVFTKKFGTMVDAGLPILKTLKMLVDQSENPHLKVVIQDIHNKVESGSPLSDAFANHPKVFDPIYINLLRSGETSGKLTFFLQRLTQQLEKSEKIRSKVKGALMYPIILLSVAIAVILIMLIKVVPVFQKMFGSMGHELPGPTKLIVSMSEFMREPSQGGLLIASLILTFLVFRYVVRTNAKAKYKWHARLLKTPLIREIIMKSTLAKIAMIQGNLSAAGVSVLESMEIIKRGLKNVLYQEIMDDVKQGVAQGQTLSANYMAHEPLIPPTFSQMIAVGEETGQMDEMFDSVAKYYEEEFDSVVDRLTEMLEPIMIVFMGTTIGFMIIAMYMPIFQVGQALSK